ncbi:MAG: 4-hydroxyphenylacetate 3-monooxygenase, oxygenase component, partial [Gammaproteobacteria bacterium]|nr:4-hydroxyphenylacetate 3-monooxygenase, oxygenase component [Gammaproteobacteria bacterium]
VTAHPDLARGAATLAAWLDRQIAPDTRDLLTFEAGGERFGAAFLQPKSVADVVRRGAAMYDAAKWSGGMLGRTPDYLNVSFAALAAAAGFFSAVRPEFGANIRNYYEEMRSRDLVLTHTLVNPSYNRALTAQGLASPEVALRVVRETDGGLVVSGARLLATLGPLSDEIAVFPSTVLKADEASRAYAVAFALPSATKGMKYVCRDSYDTGKPLFDAPLSGRFEEMDAVVLFDDVLVPWERVFLYDDPAACNGVYAETNAVVHMMHQVVCKNLAKAEFIVGLLCAMARASERDRDIAVQGQIAEAMWIAETMRAFLYSGERQASEDRWGLHVPLRRPLDTARNVFPKMYPRLVELVQLLGASSLMATPSEADFSNELAPDVEKYFGLVNLEARDRVALFRLAHDVAVAGFGGRQQLYERFFFGPPALMASAYYQLYDRDDCIERVREMLSRT